MRFQIDHSSLQPDKTNVFIICINPQSEPQCGEICRKCWLKVQMFHVFYQRIEEIQMTVIKIQPTIVENLAFPTKIESNSNDSIDYHHTNELEQQKDSLFKDIDPKYDDNEVWPDVDSVNSLSESMILYFHTSP